MKKSKVLIILIIILTFLVPFVLYFIIFNNGFSNDHSVWGNFGSYIGGLISSIFSFTSFIAVLYSIELNKKEKLILEKEKSKNDEENRFFKYFEMIRDTRNNLSCSIRSNQEFEGQAVIQCYNGSYANIAITCSKYMKKGISISNIPEDPEYNSNCVENIFLTRSVESLMVIIRLSYQFIIRSKYINVEYYLELFSSILNDQEKIAFSYFFNDFIEENEIIKKYIYEKDNNNIGIKNILRQRNEYMQKFLKK